MERILLTDKFSLEEINNLPDSKLIKVMKEEPINIVFLRNASEKVQIEAFNSGIGIAYIKNPCAKVQLMAIEKDPLSYCFIENPAKEVNAYMLKHMLGNIAELRVITDAFKEEVR